MKFLGNFFGALGIGFFTLFILFFLATIEGTILHWLWPVIVPVFHLPSLTWGQSVAFVWICHILLIGGKSSVGSKTD